MNRIALVLVALLTSVARPAIAQRCCKTVDRVLLTVSTAGIAIDWLQTVDGIRQGRRESNPLLGPHPSLGKANLLIGAALLGNVAVILVPEQDLRWFVWASIIVLETQAVLTNHRAGLRLNFQF